MKSWRKAVCFFLASLKMQIMANLPLENMDMLGEKFFAFWLGVLIKGRAQTRTQRNLKNHRMMMVC